MTAEQMPATDYEALRLQSLLDAAEGRERAALASSNTFAEDFHAASAERDEALLILRDIRTYVDELHGDPALTTRRTIADELAKILGPK